MSLSFLLLASLATERGRSAFADWSPLLPFPYHPLRSLAIALVPSIYPLSTFGEAFRNAAHHSNAFSETESFQGCVIEIRRDHLDKFLVRSRMPYHSGFELTPRDSSRRISPCPEPISAIVPSSRAATFLQHCPYHLVFAVLPYRCPASSLSSRMIVTR